MTKKIKFLILLLCLAAWSATAQTPGANIIQLGDTASGNPSSSLPFQFFSAATSQQLILASEMNGAALITGIDFYCSYAPSATGVGNCSVYLGHTFRPNLATGMVPFGARFQQVSTESFACTTGWNHYELDSAFFYNGVDNLVLLICAPSSYTSIVQFDEYSTSACLSRYASYSQPAIPSYVPTSCTQYRNVMRIHTQPVVMPARCPAPTLHFDSVGADAVRMVWSPSYRDTSWTVRCITDGDTAWRSSGLIWGDTLYTLAGLTPNTRYEFRFTAYCTDTETTIIKHLETSCLPDTLPYLQGFEGIYSLPSCWSFTPGRLNKPGLYSNSYHQGSSSLKMNGGGAILPLFDTPPDSLELQFWIRNGASGNTPLHLIVGMVTDPSDMTTFMPIDTVSILNSQSWQPQIINFEDYPRDMGRIALVAQNPNIDYLYIDDLRVRRIPYCAAITGVTVDGVTDTSAVVHWPNSGANYYEAVYGPAGFDPDSAPVITYILADSLVLTGLAPNTDYDVYVRPDCYTFVAYWSPIETFRTECAPLDTLPFVEDMDIYASGVKPTDFPCWHGQASSNTCVINATAALPAHSGNRMLRWERNLSYGLQHVSLPAIDTNRYPLHLLQLEFWAMSSANHISTLVVGVVADPDDTSTFQPVDTVAIANNYMEHYVVSLEQFRGRGSFITLCDCTSAYCTAFLDDIAVCELPPCPAVDNVSIVDISDRTVTIAIDSSAGTVAWQACATTDTAVPAGLTLPRWNTPTGVVALDTSATNYLWARAICAKGDTSAWFGPLAVEPGVWNMRANRNDTMALCGVTLYDNGGPNGSPQPHQNSTLTLLPAQPGHLVSVSGTCYKGSYTAMFEILDADGTLLWTRDGNANNFYHDTLSFGPVTSSLGPITVHYITDAINSAPDFLEMQVSCIPDTCVVKRLRADDSVAATDTAIAVTWDCNGASLYEIEYGPVGFHLGSGTRTTAATNHFLLAGLRSLDRRDIHVRSICGVGDTGLWQHGTFQTLPCPEARYRDNYDSALSRHSYELSAIGMNNAPYCYTQTLIDPAYLTGLEEGITALGIHLDEMIAEDNLAHTVVYLANVSDTAFDSTFIVPDSRHRFVQVLDSANFNHGLDTGWIVMPFDHPFLWDGHSHVLVAALRNTGSGNDGRAPYSAHHHHRNAACYYVSDMPIDIDSASTCYAHSYVGDIRLFSNLCHTVICAIPTIDSVGGDYTSATFAWHGDGSDYQVMITPDRNGTGIVSTSATSHTFAGLQPATTYTLSVRKDCTDDLLGYSHWATAIFTTDAHDCPSVAELRAENVTPNSILVAWDTVDGAQGYLLQYGAHPYSVVEGADTFVAGSSCLLNNLDSGTAYDIHIRARCEANWLADGYISLYGVFTPSDVAIKMAAPDGLDFLLAPNPSKGQVTVILPESMPFPATLTVTDVRGRKVLRNELSTDNMQHAARNLTLPAGLYFVTLATPQGSSTQKLIVQ